MSDSTQTTQPAALQASAPSVRHEPAERVTPRATWLVVLCGWLVPGLGYWLLGLRSRALVAGTTILALFAMGIFIGGIRVIDVPGYAEGGVRRLAPDGRWLLRSRPVAALFEKPWYIGQVLAGPVTLAASYASLQAAAHQYPKGTAHVAEFGTLYCAVAGMLNLLVILDAGGRSGDVK